MSRSKRRPDKKKTQPRKASRGAASSGPRRLEPEEIERALQVSSTALRNREYAKAEEILKKALRGAPYEFRLVANLINALREQDKDDAALQLARNSAAKNPTVATSQHDYGVLAKLAGDLDTAREAFRRAVELNPNHAESWRNLGTLTKHTDAQHPDIAAMREALGRCRPTNADAMRLHFALGRALEQAGAYDEAFDHYVDGNRIARAGIRYRREALGNLTDRTLATFDAEWFARGPAPGASGAAPILVVGMPRSGTTLVEQILASHPDVQGVGEVDDLPIVVERESAAGAGDPEAVAALDGALLARLGKQYASRLGTRRPGARRVVDKNLLNAYHIGFLARALPNARVVFVHREAKDNLAACFAAYFTTGIPFVWDLDDIRHAQAEFDRLRAHWLEVAGDRVLDFSYEALLDDQEGRTRQLLEHCGLDWNDACLTPERTERRVTSASAVQVRSAVNKGSVGRWERFRAQLS